MRVYFSNITVAVVFKYGIMITKRRKMVTEQVDYFEKLRFFFRMMTYVGTEWNGTFEIERNV